MTTAYQWATGFPAPKGLSAKIAAAELERIRLTNKGALRAESVVDAARPKRALLHGAFEWDDTRAASAFRLKQARDLIGAVVTIEVEDRRMTPAPVRAFVHVRTKAEGSHYTTTAQAMGDAELRAQLLENALGEIRAWRVRYDALRELSRIYQAIEEVESGITKDGQRLLAA